MTFDEFFESGFKIVRVENTITREIAYSRKEQELSSVKDLDWEWIDTESAMEKDYYIVEYSEAGIEKDSPELDYCEIDNFIAKL